MSRLLLLLLAVIAPLRQEMRVEALLHSRQAAVFPAYCNGNFRQSVERQGENLRIRIHSVVFSTLDLQYRLHADEARLARLPVEVQQAVRPLLARSRDLADFITAVGEFLQGSVGYSDEDTPQDAVSVLRQKKAHCVGYSELVSAFLTAAGVKHRQVRGFFLKEAADGRLEPVSHRWLEIEAGERFRFFYDPQYRNFTSMYVVIEPGVPFQHIEKFQGVLLDKHTQIVDE